MVRPIPPVERQKPITSIESAVGANTGAVTEEGASWIQKAGNLFQEKIDTGRIVIVGVGHPLRSDDYVGSLIAKDLAKAQKGSAEVNIMDVENSPENITPTLLQQGVALVILIDALDMGMAAGSIRLLDLSDTTYPFFTTHNVPLKLILENGPKAPKTVLIGIQPANLDFGGPLSREVQSARARVVQELKRMIAMQGGKVQCP